MHSNKARDVISPDPALRQRREPRELLKRVQHGGEAARLVAVEGFVAKEFRTEARRFGRCYAGLACHRLLLCGGGPCARRCQPRGGASSLSTGDTPRWAEDGPPCRAGLATCRTVPQSWRSRRRLPDRGSAAPWEAGSRSPRCVSSLLTACKPCTLARFRRHSQSWRS